MGDDNRDGFKYMREGDIRYDQVLLAMAAEVEQRYAVEFPRFALFGYSGGGHFAHRFLMLHPSRLWACSIGAPGSVTLLDPTQDWWVGTRDMAAQFGSAADVEAMRKVSVQMIVGAADLETWEITHKPGGRHFMPDANHAGATRPERLDSLRRSFEAEGIPVQFDLVPNMAHDGLKAVPRVEAFLAKVLAGYRASEHNKAR
jgi:pimeloyl-ACP methyl ester carboxylesterase